MKKSIFIFFAISAIAMLISCKKEESKNVTETATPDVESSIQTDRIETAEEPQKKPATTPSTVYYDAASLWTEGSGKDEGKMVWVKTIYTGWVLDVVTEDGNPVEKKAKRATDNQERNFYQVIYNGDVLYIQDALITFDSKPALLDAGAFVYKKPDVTGMLDIEIFKSTICAVHNNSFENGFAKISILDGDNARTGIYVKDELLDFNEGAILAKQVSERYDEISVATSGANNELIKFELMQTLNQYDDFMWKSYTIKTGKKFAKEDKSKVIMLQDSGSLYAKSKDGPNTLEWKTYVDAGTVMNLVNGNILTANRIVDKKPLENDFYTVQYNDETLYALVDRVSFYNESEGIVLQDCVVYNSANPADYDKNKIIKKGSIVMAVDNPVLPADLRFYEVRYLDTVSWIVRQVFVREDKISLSKNDMTALQLLKKVDIKKSDSFNKEILANALKYAESQIVEEEINAVTSSMFNEIEVIDEGVYGGVIKNTDGDNINIRENPTTTAKVVGSLAENDIVTITKRTKDEFTIGGVVEYWYYVIKDDDDSVQGWVFGAYLE